MLLFCVKLCMLTNSKVLNSNMTIVFFKFQSENTQIRQFLSQVFIKVKFCILTNTKVLISNVTIVYKLQPRNTQIEHFWSKTYFFHFNLKLCILTNYSTIVFFNSGLKVRNMAFLVPTFL